MILFGYFLDFLFSRVLLGTYFYPCFFLVLSYFLYLYEKDFDHFLWKITIECFLASLFFPLNFFFEYSYFLLFYTILFTFFGKQEKKRHILLFVFSSLVSYYLYGEILYFFLQKPISFFRLFRMILVSLPLNLIITFLFSLLFGLRQKKG